jgi:hypothetical protein
MRQRTTVARRHWRSSDPTPNPLRFLRRAPALKSVSDSTDLHQQVLGLLAAAILASQAEGLARRGGQRRPAPDPPTPAAPLVPSVAMSPWCGMRQGRRSARPGIGGYSAADQALTLWLAFLRAHQACSLACPDAVVAGASRREGRGALARPALGGIGLQPTRRGTVRRRHRGSSRPRPGSNSDRGPVTWRVSPTRSP